MKCLHTAPVLSSKCPQATFNLKQGHSTVFKPKSPPEVAKPVTLFQLYRILIQQSLSLRLLKSFPEEKVPCKLINLIQWKKIGWGEMREEKKEG